MSDIESAVSELLSKVFSDGNYGDQRERIVESGVDGLFGEGELLKDVYFALESLGRAYPSPVADALVGHLAVSYLRNQGLLAPTLADAVSSVVAAGGWASFVEKKHPGENPCIYWVDGITAVLVLDRASNELVLAEVARVDVRAVEHPSFLGTIDLAEIEPSREIARARVSEEEYQRIAACAPLLNSIKIIGAMFRIIEMTGDYVKIRTQFGRPVASFQAVRHLLAECYVRAEQSQALAQYASWREGADGIDEELSNELVDGTDVFKFVSASYLHVVRACLQATGGIGFAWEHELHRHYKRAIVGSSGSGPYAVPEFADEARASAHSALLPTY